MCEKESILYIYIYTYCYICLLVTAKGEMIDHLNLGFGHGINTRSTVGAAKKKKKTEIYIAIYLA